MSDEENSSPVTPSSTTSSSSSSRLQNGFTTEETLIDEIVDLVRRFMAQPHRLYNYDGVIEWQISDNNTISIHVSIHRSDPSS